MKVLITLPAQFPFFFFFALRLSFLALILEMIASHSELPPALSGCITVALIRTCAHLKLEDAVCLILLLAKLRVLPWTTW